VTTPRRNRVDLHSHTNRSDGVLEPRALYGAMAAWGMELVAITDHDTLAGCRELIAAGLGGEAGERGPRLIVGVEINTLPDEDGLRAGRAEGELHILGLGVDPDDAALDGALARQRDGRRDRVERTLELLRLSGYDVAEHLETGPPDVAFALGRPHVARALVAAGHATSVQDAFERFLSAGRFAYVRRIGMGPREAIARIVAAGGIASLAHAPGVPETPWVVDRLVDHGLGGLEVYHSSFDEAAVERMAAFAGERSLLPTGGSDYHGDGMDYATAQGGSFVPDEVGAALLEALARRGDLGEARAAQAGPAHEPDALRG
jgi:3',5'-nucleoside bisphosphate phosphatase